VSIKQCSVEGCEKPARTRGWCPAHYKRWRGDYLREAWRTLKPFGLLFVAEPARRWADLPTEVARHGFCVIRSEQRGEFRYVQAVHDATQTGPRDA
jgi:hypothetical protein